MNTFLLKDTFDVRGKGLAIGVEIVTDRNSKKPDAEKTAALCYHSYELGLLIYNVGIYGNVLEITPPLTISTEEVNRALNLLDQALQNIQNGNFNLNKLKQYTG